MTKNTPIHGAATPAPVTERVPLYADSDLINYILEALEEINKRLAVTSADEKEPSPCVTIPPGAVRHNPSPGDLRPLTPREMRLARLQAKQERQRTPVKLGPGRQVTAKWQLVGAANGTSKLAGKATSTKKGKK